MTAPSNASKHSPAGRPKARRGRVAAVIAVVGAIGVVVALIADSLSVISFFSGPAVGQPPASSAPATAASAEPGSTPSTRMSTRPACATSDGVPVDCELPHRFETFAGECTTAGFIRWLGGRADLDVVRGVVSPQDDGICRADLRVDARGSAANMLSGEDAATIRRCFDSRSGRIVSCSQPHTIEYFATSSSGIAREGSCESAAVTYLGIRPKRRSNELRVRRIGSSPPVGDNARCVIEVVGSQRLAVSVRGIANTQLDWVD